MSGNNHSFGPKGRYQAIRRLAAGGMGEVWLVRIDEHQGRLLDLHPGLLVVKRTFLKNPNREHADRLLREESRLALRLRHDNLVETFTLDDDQGSPLLVMEYLGGRSMAQVLGHAKKSKNPVPWRVALAILRLAACGLHFAHTLSDGDRAIGLVHRDVSPANIFVTFDGRVKVIDFGVAKADDSEVQTSTGVLKGKLGYMSPEHGKGGKLTAQADLWSLGVVFWETLMAERLFSGKNPAMTLRRIVTLDVPPPSAKRKDVPEEIDMICGRLLERDLLKRFTSAADLVSAIDRIDPNLQNVDLGAFLRKRFSDLAQKAELDMQNLARPIDRPQVPKGLVSGSTDDGVDAATLVVSKSELDFMRSLGGLATLDENSIEVPADDSPTVQMSAQDVAALGLPGMSPTLNMQTAAPSLPSSEAQTQLALNKESVALVNKEPEPKAAPFKSTLAKKNEVVVVQPPSSSSTRVAFCTFGVLSILMGIAAILLAQDSPWVLYVNEDSHMVLAAHKEDAPKGVSTFYRLPKERVPLNKNGTLTIERAQLDKLISTWPGQKGRKAPHTLKERLRQAFPAVVIWLGLLSLLVGVSTFFTKFKTPFRALVLVVLMLMFGFGAIKGALGFAGLDALSAHQRSPAVIDLFKAFQ